MDLVQKSSYLQFSNIWNRQKDFDAHSRRLEFIKTNHTSPYNYQRHQEFFNEIQHHNHSINKKNDEFKKGCILYDNDLNMKRLVKVTRKIQSFNELPQKRNQTHFKNLKQINLLEENKKMKIRINSAEPQMKIIELNQDFKKHQYYQKRMEKFYADDSQRIKLKAQVNVRHYQDPNRQRSSRAQSLSLNLLAQNSKEVIFLSSSPQEISEKEPQIYQLPEYVGPTFINNQLKQKQNSTRSYKIQEQSKFDQSLKKFRSFFRVNHSIKLDQQLEQASFMYKELDQ